MNIKMGYIKEIFSTLKEKVTVYIYGMMGKFILVNGKMTKSMGQGWFFSGSGAIYTVLFQEISSAAREFFALIMEIYMFVGNGIMENLMIY